MRTRRSTIVMTAAGCALLLLTAACSSGSDGKGDGKDGDKEAVSPLQVYYDQVYGTAEDFDQAKADEQNREVEELVAACMAEEGFDYTPQENNGGTVVSSDDFDGPEWDSLEFAEQYGYGATTDPYGMQAAQETAPPEETEWVDANADYVASMSETEQAAYQDALWGPQSTQEYDEDSEVAQEYSWEDAGCYGAAQHQVYDAGASTGEDFQPLMDEMNKIYENLATNPAMTELDSTWSTCMADAGYPGLATPSDAQNSIYDKSNALYGNEDWDWEANPDGPPAPSDEALAEVTKLEIATAVADWHCKDDLDYTAKAQEVQFGLEQDFVDQHKAELDAWVAAAAEDTK